MSATIMIGLRMKLKEYMTNLLELWIQTWDRVQYISRDVTQTLTTQGVAIPYNLLLASN